VTELNHDLIWRNFGGQHSATNFGGQHSATNLVDSTVQQIWWTAQCNNFGGQHSATNFGGQHSATNFGGQHSATNLWYIYRRKKLGQRING